MPQFNKGKSSDLIWFNLTYQSNDQLNEETHNKIKILIAEILLKKCGIVIDGIYSYVHGNIIFSIKSALLSLPRTFDKIVFELQEPLAKHTPKLLFNFSIVGIDKNNPWSNFMYIDGDSELNDRFEQSIKHLRE